MATAAATAATVNPLVKPFNVLPVRLAAATLDTTAAPMEAPNSWKVLTMPEAIPASWGATWLSAVAEAMTNIAPVPAAATTTPATTPAGCMDTAGTAMPTAAAVRPATADPRAPHRPIARPVRWAPSIVASATGRKSSPVRNAPYPRACWK
jgi:hypothetical protein